MNDLNHNLSDVVWRRHMQWKRFNILSFIIHSILIALMFFGAYAIIINSITGPDTRLNELITYKTRMGIIIIFIGGFLSGRYFTRSNYEAMIEQLLSKEDEKN